MIHDHPFLHWDLLLEAGEVLRAWRLLAEPAADVAIAAEALPDHRPVYLDYEGPVSGNRGTVARWDTGEFCGDVHGSQVSLQIQGERLRGTVTLVEVHGPAGWRFRYESAESSRSSSGPAFGDSR